MTNGVKATEILRTILPASNSSQNNNEADLIQTAINMAGTSTKNTSQVPTTSCSSTAAAGSIIASASAAATTTSPANHCPNGSDSSALISGLGSKPPATGSSGRNDKCPLLMELLYKSFQAKLAKEHRLKLALQHEQQQQSSLKHKPAASQFSQSVTSAVTSGCLTKANSINAANSLVTQQPTVNTNQGPVVSQCNGINVHVSPAAASMAVSQQQQTAVAAHEAALAAAMMQQHQTAAATAPTAFLLSPEPNILTAAVQHHHHHQQQHHHQHQHPPQQHHQAVPYPYIQAYYSQMINPNAAAAGLWPFPTAATSTPLIHQNSAAAEAAVAAAAAAQLMMPANVMPYNQIGHGPGVKRAAAPVMYANVEKRMKLA